MTNLSSAGSCIWSLWPPPSDTWPPLRKGQKCDRVLSCGRFVIADWFTAVCVYFLVASILLPLCFICLRLNLNLLTYFPLVVWGFNVTVSNCQFINWVASCTTLTCQEEGLPCGSWSCNEFAAGSPDWVTQHQRTGTVWDWYSIIFHWKHLFITATARAFVCAPQWAPGNLCYLLWSYLPITRRSQGGFIWEDWEEAGLLICVKNKMSWHVFTVNLFTWV